MWHFELRVTFLMAVTIYLTKALKELRYTPSHSSERNSPLRQEFEAAASIANSVRKQRADSLLTFFINTIYSLQHCPPSIESRPVTVTLL